MKLFYYCIKRGDYFEHCYTYAGTKDKAMTEANRRAKMIKGEVIKIEIHGH